MEFFDHKKGNIGRNSPNFGTIVLIIQFCNEGRSLILMIIQKVSIFDLF